MHAKKKKKKLETFFNVFIIDFQSKLASSSSQIRWANSLRLHRRFAEQTRFVFITDLQNRLASFHHWFTEQTRFIFITDLQNKLASFSSLICRTNSLRFHHWFAEKNRIVFIANLQRNTFRFLLWFAEKNRIVFITNLQSKLASFSSLICREKSLCFHR